MTLSSPTVGAAPAVGPAEQAAERTAGQRLMRGVLIGLALVVVLFIGTYAIAWFSASRLTATFMADADASYEAGNYVESLTGYEEFDQASNAYVTYGGYMKALNIWASPNAWPRPAGIDRARARIDEVLQEHLTIEEAESFIQANVGQQNPFMGTIYLRLGELYEEEGDIASARAIYDEIDELFPGEEELIARAAEHLTRLGGE
jgi:tetratricopeptide (TPR) repeat protein